MSRPRLITRPLAVPREVTQPMPAVPPGPGAVVGGRWALGGLLRESDDRYVFAGVDRTETRVAVMVSLFGAPTSAEAGGEFIRAVSRVRAAAAPGVAPILEAGLDRAAGLFVVERVGEHVDLATILERERLPVIDAVALTHRLAGSLAELHHLGLAHGALRPRVILLDEDLGVERPLIVDAAARAARRATRRFGAATPYDAPEGDGHTLAKPAEDIYALGALLFRMVVGRPPAAETWQHRLSELCPDAPVPGALDDIVARTLNPDLETRPQQVGEVSVALARAIMDLTGPPGGDVRPTELGRYTLVRLLARGGMGEVFLARAESAPLPNAGFADLESGAPHVCVVKRIRGEHVTDEERIARFVTEARLASRMRHENIVTVYDLGRTDDDLFIVMEHVAGKDLRDLMTRLREAHQEVPMEVALYLARELARGLAYVHGFAAPDVAPEGLVHRDVNPRNVLLGYDGRVKLIDFGLARGGLGGPQTSAGVVVGKLGYLAPEQALGQVATPKSDLFAAGLVLWELLCGRDFFEGEPEEIAAAVRAPRPDPPSAHRTGLPPEVDAVCLKALAVAPEERFASAQELDVALSELLEKEGVGDVAAQASALVSQVFADERRGEEAMLEAAAATAPVLGESATEALGHSLLTDSGSWVLADTTRTVVDFDEERADAPALTAPPHDGGSARDAAGGTSLRDTARHLVAGRRPSRGLVIGVSAAVATLALVFLLLLRASCG